MTTTETFCKHPPLTYLPCTIYNAIPYHPHHPLNLPEIHHSDVNQQLYHILVAMLKACSLVPFII